MHNYPITKQAKARISRQPAHVASTLLAIANQTRIASGQRYISTGMVCQAIATLAARSNY